MGIGRSRIVRHLSARASQRRIPVYEVHHRSVEGIPFKPFIHAIRNILRDHDPGAVLLKKYRSGLENLIPEVFEKSPEAEKAAEAEAPLEGAAGPALVADTFEAEMVRIFDAITQLLLEVTARKPLLLVVHDLHWSDQSTIELLKYIGRNLRLRNSRPMQNSDQPLSEAPSGPEVDGFENEEWRTLARQSARVAGYLGGWASGADESGAQRTGFPPARLMIVANYGGFSEPDHYLERSILDLGGEPFAFHCHLQALRAEDAERFIVASTEGVEIDGQSLEVRADAVEAIYERSEGFPTFAQELLRALYWNAKQLNGTPPAVWTRDKVDRLLGDAVASSATSVEVEERDPVGVEKREGTGVAVLPPPPEVPLSPIGPRHAILRVRLAKLAATEREVLCVLAVAKRPVSAELIDRVLSGAGTGSSAEALRVLRERGIVEEKTSQWDGPEHPSDSNSDSHTDSGTASGDRTDGASGATYFFRLWDYTRVVEADLDPDRARTLHQRLGEQFLSTLDGSDERAFEVYYHLYRGAEPRSALEPGLRAAERFRRSYALVKARGVYQRLAGILAQDDDLLQRLQILEEIARLSAALRETDVAEEVLRQAESEGASVLSAERRAELLFLEADALAVSDPARGLKILNRIPRLLGDENSRSGARLQLATARLRLRRQDVKRAINFCLKGIGISQKVGSLPELGELYRTLATAFYRKGDYTHAVDNYLRALDAFESLDLKDQSVDTLDDLGRVYLERGHYFRAARYLYKSLEIRRRLHDVQGLCRSYDQLALVYLRSGDDLRTIENLNRTLVLKERIGDFQGLNPTLSTLGELYQRLGNYDLSLFYFNWEVENSQRLGDTDGLVEAFCSLGRAYFEIGDLRQATSYAKQVSILSTEFSLKAQEADGRLLEAHLKGLERDWAGAEKDLKFAVEVHGRLGQRRREAGALLDTAELKLERELHDESLKFASKGQIIADEVKALDLQVWALTLKGDIHRFLKGGNVEKATEFLQKAVDLAQDVSDAGILFRLFYSFAKLCHSERDFAEAANYYARAELILKKVSDGLSDDLAARFNEDSRRKVFFDDLARFRKDSHGRTQGGVQASLPPAIRERTASVVDFKDLSSRMLRVHGALNKLHFHDHVLGEALELTGADRGFILRVQHRQYLPAAFRGFGKNPAQHPEYMAAGHVAQETIRKGRTILTSGNAGAEVAGEWNRRLQIGGLVHRSILSVPFMTDDRIFGAVYLDKPVSLEAFSARDRLLVEIFSQHCAVALDNRREFETMTREPLTGLYTPSYFVDRLREAYRFFNLHGKAFALLAFYVPTLEEVVSDERDQLGGRLSQELAEVLPPGVAVCWGSPILTVLLEEGDAPLSERYAEAAGRRLRRVLSEEVPSVVIPVEGHYQQGADIYFEARRRLMPQEFDQRVVSEVRAIFAQDVTLRDAKKILERYKIESTLQKTSGNITHAARELGIHRPQLSNLLKKHDLKRERFEQSLEADEESTTE